MTGGWPIALSLQSNPNIALAHTSMETAALIKQDDLRAVQHFEQALALDQNNRSAWLGKAMIDISIPKWRL